MWWQKNKHSLYALFLCTVLCAYCSVFAEFIVPPAPTNSRILDEVGVLDITQKQTLEQTLTTLETETKHQIGIAIIQSLQWRSIDEAGLAIARGWWIGQKWLDNGLLILVAPTEREMKIEVGRWLEWVVTDLQANRIIDEYMAPAFQKEDYFWWLDAAIGILSPLMAGEIVDLPEPPVDTFGVLFGLMIWLVWGGFFLWSVFFEWSKAWWPGIVIGVLLGWAVLWFTVGTLLAASIGMMLSGSILGGMDWAFSTGKVKAMRSRPHGGRWGGGGWFWGGFWGGGGGWFWGGGFGGGGASGRW